MGTCFLDNETNPWSSIPIASRNSVYGIFVANVARISACVLRTKFWVKSACEDAPQVVAAWARPQGSTATVVDVIRAVGAG